MIIFRQLYDARSSTYTYLLADEKSKEAILIDPVFEQMQRDAALIEELGLTLLYTVETHVHADHITSAWLFKQQLGSQIVLSKTSGVTVADLTVTKGDRINFGQHYLTVHDTPGHTSGCITLVLDDKKQAFTGDCLLIRGSGRTDFQQGSANTMYKSVYENIYSLPDECLLWPAHDYQGRTVTTVCEEKKYNPRLGSLASESDFVGYMQNLNLAHPKQIDQALPANMACGKTDSSIEMASKVNWAPLRYTYSGVWEIDPQRLEERIDQVQLIDVREESEYSGILGHIRSSKHIPLDQLLANVEQLSKEIPIVIVCRSGTRSAQAAVLLKREGFTEVANLAGGMINWQTNQLPVYKT